MKWIACQPALPRFEWELDINISRLVRLGIEPGDIVLLFTPNRAEIPVHFREIGCEVHEYKDSRKSRRYSPSIKPYLLSRYLGEDRARTTESYFLMDSDVLFREIPKVPPDTNCWYGSDCSNYLSIGYIDSKEKGLLESMCEVVGADPVKIREANPTAGAQWVISHPDPNLWAKIEEDSVRLYEFLDAEEPRWVKQNPALGNPIQKWTAEMWASSWGMITHGIQVKTHPELDFCWPTDPVERYWETKILHNAGVTDQNADRLFWKAKFRDSSPLQESMDHVDPNTASFEYCRAMKEVNVMAKYRVVQGFRDKTDMKPYYVGDRFPKPPQRKVPPERIEELVESGVIEFVEE